MNMNVMGGVGGPVGGQQMMNMGTPGNAPGGNGQNDSHRTKLHTYMYDYFLKNGMFDLARMLLEKADVDTQDLKQSPGQRNVNGDSMDQDSKDNILGKPDDLPLPKVPPGGNGSFLADWWDQFWDCYLAQRGRGNPQTKQYLNQVQNHTRLQNERRNMMANPQMQTMMRNSMMANGNDMKKAVAINGQRQLTPQQMQQLQQARQQQMIMGAGQMMPQTQMQREGSSMDGQQRPQTPGSGENAPSPKRQRIDGGSFNGQMPPMGRGQPQGMPNQQVYAQSMRQQMQSALDVNSDKGMQNPNVPLQGSPAMDANADFFNGQMRGMPGAGPTGQNSNHALQDYQMQLMLLEQQNKKRLLMARQEQDSAQNGPNGPAMPGQFAPAMSPSNSRTGPSPNPDEQMKRGTPKMAPGMPPNPDGSMPQGRGSPVPGFDPSQMNPNMPPAMFNQMAKMQGMMGGPNGQMNGQMMPATSHPAMMNGQGPPMTAQQTFEMMQNGGPRRPGGPWPQGPPQMMPGQQPPQPPNMTPQQRNAAMPPPPAPPQGETARTQPSSPSQSQQAPPTPSQTNKANPKGKKEGAKNNKKAPAKKGGAAAATPASEGGEQPPTPTPAPPITPTAPAQQFKNGPNQQPNQQGQNPGVPGQQQPTDLGQSFGALDGSNGFDMSLDFGTLDGQDVLEQFDFDSFLNNDNGDASFAFDANMNFADGGLEAGGDV